MLDLALEIGKIKRFLNETTDSFEFKERLHRRSRAGQHDDGSFPGTRLFLKVIVAIGAKLAKIRQSIFAFWNSDIKKHAIGSAFFRLLKAFRPIERGQNFIAKNFELLFDDLTDIILVINHKNTFFIHWLLDLNKFQASKRPSRKPRAQQAAKEILLLAQLNIQKILELSRPGRMTQLSKRLGLNLTNSLARYIKNMADLFQSPRVTVPDPES